MKSHDARPVRFPRGCWRLQLVDWLDVLVMFLDEFGLRFGITWLGSWRHLWLTVLVGPLNLDIEIWCRIGEEVEL